MSRLVAAVRPALFGPRPVTLSQISTWPTSPRPHGGDSATTSPAEESPRFDEQKILRKLKQITNLLFEARATLANVDWPRIELLLVPGRYELKFIPPPADGFASRTITSVLVSTDTLVIIDFCPIYLPIILKDR